MGGQFINSEAKYENYANYAEERDSIIQLITTENIPGVFFLSGDRHASELSMLPRENTYPLYDLTVSPLTAGPNKYAHDEKNAYRVDGTLLEQRNFAVMRFSGPRTDRLVTIALYDVDGKELWSKAIKATDLKTKK